MPSPSFQAPRGTHDVLPTEAPVWELVEATARAQARLADYREIRTPMFENTAVFQRGVGEATDIVEKEMYTFLDKGGDSMTLRPEGTAPIIRAYLQHGMASLRQPVKLFSFIDAFRYDRPSRGRFRQFHQFDVEAIGDEDPLLDADLVALQWRFYAALGLRDVSLQINSIGDATCRPAYIQRLAEYFGQHVEELCGDCRRRLPTNPLRLLDDKTPACQSILDGAPRSTDHLCDACRDHFEQWQAYLAAAGIPATVNHRLVRGLDYYTRSVWEVWPPREGAQSTIGGGGRYDGLAEQVGGRHTPAVGFATGLERVMLEMSLQGVQLPEAAGPRAFVVSQTPAAKGHALTLAERLRASGIQTDLAFGNRKLDKQLNAANSAGATYALILGDDELANGTVTVKNLHTREQQTIPEAELPDALGSVGAST